MTVFGFVALIVENERWRNDGRAQEDLEAQICLGSKTSEVYPMHLTSS
jgi:hypothetical protein